MEHDQLFHDLVLLGLLWLWGILLWVWPRGHTATCQTTPTLATPITKRSKASKPFPGLIHKPYCEACEHAAEPRQQPPSAPPPRMVPLALPQPMKGRGSVKLWYPCTPARAAGLTDRIWTLREVLLFRVPPWPQPQGR
jgi:hypothetical protein